MDIIPGMKSKDKVFMKNLQAVVKSVYACQIDIGYQRSNIV